MLNKKALFLAALSAVSLSVNSAELFSDNKDVTLGDWMKSDSDATIFAMTAENTSVDFQAMVAEISMSTGGQKRMYFTVVTGEYDCKDDDEYTDDNPAGEKRSNQVWKFNDQHVKMFGFCNDNTWSATPVSIRGRKFIENTFKNSKRPVRVTSVAPGVVFSADISATGFTKAWNDFGGDAL